MFHVSSVNSKIRQRVSNYLKNVYEFTDDACRDLFEKFETTIREAEPRIRSAFADKDAVRAAEEMHAIKGVLANSGLMEESAAASELQAAVVNCSDWKEAETSALELLFHLLETSETSSRQKILVVDDMLFSREFMKKSLFKLFPTIITIDADSGRAALELLGKETFDLVLCDWELPGVKGCEVLAHLRSQAETQQTPFIMITANSEKEHVIQAKKLGATDYVLKPVKLDTLATKVRGFLSSRSG